jgi:hypothetical protein
VFTEADLNLPYEVAIAHPDDIARVVGRRLPAELFKFVPWGRRLLAVREPPAMRYGSIIIPASVRADQQKSVGWILSAGPDVGKSDPSGRTPAGIAPAPGIHLLLRCVLFGKYVGTPFLVNEKESQEVVDLYGGDPGDQKYLNPYILLTDADILGEVLDEALGQPPTTTQKE